MSRVLAFAGLTALAVLAVLAHTAPAQAQLSSTPLETLSTDGSVDALVVSGRTLYLGGSFSRLGPRTGPWVALDQSSAQPAQLPQVSGGGQLVSAVAPDGSGGWYVGGNFTHIGGVARDELAHVLSNGAIDPSFDPEPSGGGFTDITAIAASSSTVYVGGRFSSIGGEKRHNLAALDATTGIAEPSFDPSPNNPVYAIALNGTSVYVGGGFTTIGSTTRNGIAKIDAVSGTVLPWNPDAMASSASGGFPTVYALAATSTTVYAGGAFDSIGGATRPALAALSASSGSATSWNPSPSGGLTTGGRHAIVYAIAPDGSTVYAGGDFTSIGGRARTDIAALQSGTGQAAAFNANVGGSLASPGGLDVDALAVSASTVYIGGSFSVAGGQPRSDLAALDAGSGDPSGWNPSPNGSVAALAVSGSLVYAGGDFTAVAGVTRHNLAAIDLPTDTVLPWNPGTSGNGGRVDALAVRGSTVFAGGDFNVAGGFPRRHLAALNAATGAPTGWNPGANGSVAALQVSGSKIYAAGSFTKIGGRRRDRIAALRARGGKVTGWNPAADGPIYALVVSPKAVYAGGSFTTIGAHARNRLAAISTKTGRASGFSANANGPVYALALSHKILYVGGAFGTVAGRHRRLLAAVGARNGAVKSWNPGVRGSFGGPYASVRALAVAGSTVYVGGSFSSVGGLARSDAAAVGRGSGAPTAWDPAPNNYVSALATFGPDVLVGGFFTGFDLGGQQGIAVFGPS